MALKVGINGFGRIGRMVLRSIIENNRKDIEIVAINNRSNSEISSFLLKHDTVHGKLKLNTDLSWTDHAIHFNKKLLISESPLLLIATISRSFLLFSTTDLKAILPILPNPFIPIFKAIIIYPTFFLQS